MNGGSLGVEPFDQIEQLILELGWLGQRHFLHILSEERCELTIPQFYTLLHLSHRDDECKMSELARATQQSAASLTGVVDRLLEKRLVARIRPEGDRRQVMVTVTDEGRALLAHIREARRQAIYQALAHLAEHEINALQASLSALLNGMQRAVEAYE